MRLSVIKKQIKEYYEILNLECQQVTINGNTYQKIMNWKNINRALHSLNEYKFVGNSINKIFDMGANFIASTDTTAVLDSKYTFF